MRSILLLAILVTFIVVCSLTNPAPRNVYAQQAQPSGTPTPPRVVREYKGYSEPRYKDITTASLYVPMADGTRIAIDVLLPKDLPQSAKIPALLNFTRYWRAQENQQPSELQKFFVSHGYALIFVDVRGTGASYGTWTMPWSEDEIKDYGAIVDWAVSQPWCNGKVGAFGSSYGGNSAQLLAKLNHPAVKAILPRHYEFDEFTDVPFPGGIFNEWMVRAWDEANHKLDRGEGVKPVDADTDRSLLRKAIQEHAKNIDLYKAVRQISFRDDRINFGGGRTVTIDDISVHSYRKEVERSRVAINSWGGWFDAGTADGVIKSFLNLNNPQRAMIGAWNHGASQNASPYFSAGSQRVSILYEWLRFFDHHLKGVDTDIGSEKILFYYTMGEERWKATRVWPVAGTKTERWYMDANNLLSRSAPALNAGADTYKVDFEASTGEKNRWRTQLGGPVVYPDRATEDRRLIVYTSQPLTEDMEITGHPVVTLHVTSTHTDGAFFVYLEDVDESGKVTYLTEGQLRSIHRKVSNDAPPYTMTVPYHTFRKKDAMPLVPNEVAKLEFGLLPTSVLIRKGHRIRVAIAGHDKSVFARVPADGTPVITIARNKQYASFIELPVVRARPQAETPINLLTYFIGSAGQSALKVDPKIYEAYAGQYELEPGFIIIITKEDEKLMGVAPGQPKVELFPESETKFFLKEANIQITFIKDNAGKTSGLVLRQNGQDIKAKKIK